MKKNKWKITETPPPHYCLCSGTVHINFTHIENDDLRWVLFFEEHQIMSLFKDCNKIVNLYEYRV